eukprot:s485_g14.t1
MGGYCISPQQAAEMQKNGPGYLKMLVSNVTAGILIGKGGQSLKDLEAATGCNVKLSSANHFYPGSGHRVVCVAGKEEAVESVLATVVEATLEAERHVAQKEQREVDDRVTLQIALPFSACGLVIGKGGSIQKEIVDKTGIAVKITPKGENVVPHERVASLVGASRAVLAAGVEVFRLSLGDASLARHLETPSGSSMMGGGMGGGGMGGSMGGNMGGGMGNGAMGGGMGGAEQWQSSNRWDQRNDWTATPPPTAAPVAAFKGAGKGGMPGGGVSTVSTSTCQIYFEVSDMEAAHIIGKGGNFLQSVCVETGAKVVLSKRGEQIPGVSARLVTVTGPVQSVHRAHIRVLERAAEMTLNA